MPASRGSSTLRAAPQPRECYQQKYSALPLESVRDGHVEHDNQVEEVYDAAAGTRHLAHMRALGCQLVLSGLGLAGLLAIAMSTLIHSQADRLGGGESSAIGLPPAPPSAPSPPPWWQSLPVAASAESRPSPPPAPAYGWLKAFADPAASGAATVTVTAGTPGEASAHTPLPSAPPPFPSPSPPTCASLFGGLENLRERSPPLWCFGVLSQDLCQRSYIKRSDGQGYSRCVWEQGKCAVAREFHACPLPPPPPPPPPTPPEPPPAMPPLPVVDQINIRFNEGGPTADIAKAGVLVHTFDDITDSVHPWLPCPETRWCGRLRDRFAASLIYPPLRDVYSKGDGGFVVNPKHAKVLCSYHGDGHSMAKSCDRPGVSKDCVPGCGGGYEQCEVVEKTSWCTCPQGDFLCAWRPNELEQMMRQQQSESPNGFLLHKGYNEVPHFI